VESDDNGHTFSTFINLSNNARNSQFLQITVAATE
jgi:hypothetical protein